MTIVEALTQIAELTWLATLYKYGYLSTEPDRFYVCDWDEAP